MAKPVGAQAVFRWVSEAMVQGLAVPPSPLTVMVLGGEDVLLLRLKGEGHEVFRVRDAAEASRAGSQLRPGVLLVDLDEIDGDVEDLVHRLRENRLSLFVVGLTAKHGKAREGEIFDSVLEKPLRPEQLRRSLRLAQEA
jgi:DNA-binding response OmpR family regulator